MCLQTSDVIYRLVLWVREVLWEADLEPRFACKKFTGAQSPWKQCLWDGHRDKLGCSAVTREASADPLGAQAGMVLQNCSELGLRGCLQGLDLGHGGSLQLRAMAGREDLAGS